MKIRKNPKKNRTRHAIPVVILSTVLLFTMSVFYIDSTSSSAAGTDHLFLPDSTRHLMTLQMKNQITAQMRMEQLNT